MKKIMLCCNAGMSTGLLVKKMREAAEAQGIRCQIGACSVSEAGEKAKDADVILLGPQVRYELKKLKAMFPGKPVEAVAPADYGMLRGDRVLQAALSMTEEQDGA